MSGPCDTCALRSGSVTHDNEPHNHVRAKICALAGLPFFCHHGLNWRKPITVRKGTATDVDGNRQPLRVCAGWRAEVAANLPQGRDNWLRRAVRRAYGQQCLDTLEAAIAETDDYEKSELWAELKVLFKRLLKASPKPKLLRTGDSVE